MQIHRSRQTQTKGRNHWVDEGQDPLSILIDPHYCGHNFNWSELRTELYRVPLKKILRIFIEQ